MESSSQLLVPNSPSLHVRLKAPPHSPPLTRPPPLLPPPPQVGLEGLGAPLELDAVPRLVTMPGTLTLGGQVSRSVTLRNPSRAPAHFRITPVSNEAESAAGNGGTAGYGYSTTYNGPLSVQPATGVVPPLSEVEVEVTFSALEVLEGKLQQSHQLLCQVRRAMGGFRESNLSFRHSTAWFYVPELSTIHSDTT